MYAADLGKSIGYVGMARRKAVDDHDDDDAAPRRRCPEAQARAVRAATAGGMNLLSFFKKLGLLQAVVPPRRASRNRI
jgi:hypothetical protein